MKLLFVLLLIFLLAWRLCSAATSQTGFIIQGGQVTVQSAYIDIGSTQTITAVTSSTLGQCIGILCGVTHAN